MTLSHITSAIAALTLGLASFGARAVIVDIDARSSTGTTVSFDAGSYVLSWAGIAGGGLYDAWQYNNAASGNFREVFSVTAGGTTASFDRNDGNNSFNNYATAAAALFDFQTASGRSAFVAYGSGGDRFAIGNTFGAPLTFTLTAQTALTFNVPDNVLSDNRGGVSLAITSAVPEPETYALVLGGLGALAFVARRRKPNAA